MDRLDKESSPQPPASQRGPRADADALAAGLAGFPTSAGDGHSPLVAVGPGWKVRLDSGHHRARSRWLGREVDHHQRRRRAGPVDSTRCSVVVGTRRARVLAAMVHTILGPEAGLARATPPTGRTCLTTIGGRTAADPIGVVRFEPPTATTDYLLTHSSLSTQDDQPAAADLPSVVERFSLAPGWDWWAGDVKGVSGCYRFRAYHRGNYRAEIRLQVPGAHHILPALAAVAIGLRMNVPARAIKDRLEEFLGLPRGFESRGTFRGATLVDDDATAADDIGAALGLAREVFGSRPIRVVYLPDLTATAEKPPTPRDFDEANHLILVDQPLAGTESTRLLAASLRSSGASVVCCSNLDSATRELDRGLEPGDVLVTLGAGEVGTIADAFLRRLSRDRHG